MLTAPATPPPPGELVLTGADFRRIADVLQTVSGITLTDTKESLVYSRLVKRVRALGLPSFASYCDLIAAPEGEDECAELLSALTTNFTRFFRERHHFTDLGRAVLAPFAARQPQGRLRIWSAACSSGEEAYSIAMTVFETVPRAARQDIRILATDIDRRILSAAEDGVYLAESIEPLSPAQRAKYLVASGDSFTVSGELRAIIRFAELNLTHTLPMSGKFDAIFCRNVAIYFSAEQQQRLWMRLAERLMPGGRLYIGHSERVAGAGLGLLELVGVTTYALRDGRIPPGRS
jgi:chemotaxis protein methyltransferase CheR